MKTILLLLLLLHFKLQAQFIPVFIEKHPYLKSVYVPAEDAQARLLTCSWQYLYTYQYESFRSGGMQPTFGLNIARFFSNKFILGICFDIKSVKGFTQQRFSDKFISDFNESFKTSYGKSADSARAYVINHAINDVPGHGFTGNFSGNIGIMFSLFPQKYGGILIMAKRGYRDFPVSGTRGNTYINNGALEYTLFQIKNNYSVEISAKPYTIMKNGYFRLREGNWNDMWKLITVGFYYERLDIENATFNGMPFAKVVTNKFISRYGVDHCYGVKLGLSLY